MSGSLNAYSLPMWLTYGRMLAIPALVTCMLQEAAIWYWVSGILFGAAAITDYFDGKLARSRNEVSALGTLLDPIADKLLVAAALILLPVTDRVGELASVAIVLIISRELFVSGLREFGASRGIKVPVTVLAKWKTTVQMVALGILIASTPVLSVIVPDTWIGWVAPVGEIILWIATALTLITGWDYLVTTLRQMSDPPSPEV